MDVVEAIRAEFDFLLDRGFAIQPDEVAVVRYDHANGVVVWLFHSERERLVTYRVGRSDNRQDALTDGEVVRLLSDSFPRSHHDDRGDPLHTSIARLARGLRTFGQRALDGDEALDDEAQQLRAAYTSRYTRDP